MPCRVLASFLLASVLSLPAARAGDLATLVEWMTGSFSSAAQAANHHGWADVRLEIVPIWTERSDGPWLYVEQALADSRDQPYRQGVYRLQDDGNSHYRIEVFAFPDPPGHAGAWTREKPLEDLSPDDLTPLDGCTIDLERVGPKDGGDFGFVGSTRGRECENHRNGASWSHSEVRIDRRRLGSWDRGFDADGRQAWGNENGGTIFDRVTPKDD